MKYSSFITSRWGGGVWRRCCVSYVIGHPNILAYSRARLAILVAGKGSGECFYFFCFNPFIPVPLSSLSLSFISTISSISFLPFSGRWHKMTHKSWHVVKPQHNHANQYRCFCKQCRIQMRWFITSHLIRIYTVCHCHWFLTWTPICNSGCVQIQGWKSLFKILNGEMVNG